MASLDARIIFVSEGTRFALGHSAGYVGIWDKSAGSRGAPRVAATVFPATDDGWALARAQFEAWEPNAVPITPTPASGRHPRWLVPAIGAGIAVVVATGVVAAAVVLGSRSSKTDAPVAARSLPKPDASTFPPPSSPSTTEAQRQPGAPGPTGSGFLASGDGYAVFIQWTDDRGALVGTPQDLSAQGQPPEEKVDARRTSINGQLTGSALQLNFNGSALQFGTLSGNTLTINFPQADGTLHAVTFHKASVGDYNQAVISLQSAIGSANNNATHANAVRDGEGAADRSASTLESDVAALQAASVADSLGSLPRDLATQANDVAHTKQDAAKAEAEAQQHPDGDSGSVCFNVAGVANDAAGVVNDAAGVANDAAGAKSDITGIRNNIKRAQTDLSTFQASASAVSGYSSPGAPSTDQVAASIDAANKVISEGLASANTAIDEASGAVATAYGYADQATNAGSCGTAPVPGTPEPHIS